MKRILIKLSGEALANNSKENVFDPDFVDEVAAALATCAKEGYEIGVVVGAGNIWRGRQSGDIDRVAADRMGMLATVINSIYLKDAIERQGVPTSVMTAISVSPFAEPYSSDIAKKYLSEGRIVIFGAGTGMPFFSKDFSTLFNAFAYGAEKSVAASFGAPSIYYNYFETAPAYLNTYSMDKSTMRAFVGGILGDFEFTGSSPVALRPNFVKKKYV